MTYTYIALAIGLVSNWITTRQSTQGNDRDRPLYDQLKERSEVDDVQFLLLLHIRQDVAFIAMLISGMLLPILLLIGLIADGAGPHIEAILAQGWTALHATVTGLNIFHSA